jgi:hypothetical protein
MRGEKMSEIKSKGLINLVREYADAHEFYKSHLEEENPHVNFKELMANPDFMQEVEKTRPMPSVQPNTGATANLHSRNTQGGNNWIGFLEIAAWISFLITVVSGIISAVSLSEIFGGGIAFVVFLVMVASAFLILSVIMVFLTTAKDISRTAKDTAEIKEILKNK